MTQEEKARAYDEALKKARFYHGNCPSEPERKKLEKMFPVLHESEDERIRKTLLEYFNERNSYRDEDETFNGVPFSSIIAYLEKQKEPRYAIRATKGFGDPAGPQFKLVDLQEEQKVDIDKLRRDLYQSGYNDGYQHGKEDAQKEQKPAEWSDYKDKVNVPYCSSEPEWSEEDEDMLNSCISSIEEAKENRYAYKETDGDTSYDHEIAWLKSIRPSWKPSEEQMEALQCAIVFMEIRKASDYDITPLKSLYEQLKKLM